MDVVARLIADQLTWERVLSGAIQSHWSGPLMAYTNDPGVDQAELETRARAIMDAKQDWAVPADLFGYADQNERPLIATLSALAAAGQSTIDGSLVERPARRGAAQGARRNRPANRTPA